MCQYVQVLNCYLRIDTCKCNGYTKMWTYQLLHHSTTTGSRVVIRINFKLISINKVNVRFPFPGVGDPCDRDQFNGLTLQKRDGKRLLHNRYKEGFY